MFRVEINNPKQILNVFEAVSYIVDEVQLQTDNEGIRLNAIDRGHISFVTLDMKHHYCTEYVCDEPQKINLDTSELLKVLKRAKSDDTMIMSLDEGNLIIIFDGESKRTFKIRLIDITYESPVPPSIDYPCEVEIPIKLLKESVTDVGLFSDKIYLKTDSENLIIYADGEFGDTSAEYKHNEVIDNVYSSVFSLEKVKEMIKADKLNDFVIIKMGNDMPLRLIMKTVAEDLSLSFILAPRIETE